MNAIKNGDVEYVENAIQKNKNVLYTGVNYTSNPDLVMYPVHMAVYSGNYDICKLVINEKNANVIFKELMFSPLQTAIMYHNADIVQLLIDNGADVNYVSSKDGFNIFHVFAIYDRSLSVWNKIKEYANTENINSVGSSIYETPFNFLFVYCLDYDDIEDDETFEVVKEFIEYGANPNILMYTEDWTQAVFDFFENEEYDEWIKILIDGMKNNSRYENTNEGFYNDFILKYSD